MKSRIAKAIRDSGLSKKQIADACGVSTAAVSQWESRETKTLKSHVLLALARVTGKNPDWLATGQGPEVWTPVQPDSTNLVPVIPFATIGDVPVGQDQFPASMAASRTICPVNHGSRTFCTQMPDDSMACNDPRAIYRGAWLHVDPDRLPVPHDTTVLAVLESGSAVVAQYMQQAGREWLALLNPHYPALPQSFRLLGRVIYVAYER